jgi:serine-type D-Ala-D-Ala carboxypeptidase (penicillin-binding protein 5/6)
VQKNGSDKLIARIVYNGPVRAPVEPGRPIGIVRVMRGANVAVETPVYAVEAVGTGSLTRRAFDGASELVVGLFRAGVAKL